MNANENRPPARTFCTFQLRNGLFGVDALAVKEITVVPTLTPIPHAPAAVGGYVNLRGQIVLVLDANRMLDSEPTPLTPDARVIVFRAHLGDAFGILVDRIGDIAELRDAQIERNEGPDHSHKQPVGSPPPEALIEGVGKLRDSLLTILDAAKLLPHIESAIDQSSNHTHH
jgi:purine-binding chemotaxis protein CheW